MTISPELAKLAAAHGVAIEYKDQLERTVEVSSDSVVAVLRALGVDATTPSAVAAALEDVERRSATPPVVVMRQSQTRTVVVDDVIGLLLETGEQLPHRGVGGAVTLAGLPTGWHTLRTSTRDIPVVVAPDRVTAPTGRHWGLMTQLYAMRSRTSWGIGDLHDLGTLSDWTAQEGGGLVLVNPLHATAPIPPLQDSPYYPASRRWTNPLYLRVEDTSEYADASAEL
ncbi:MAG TPA: 4-alpha-glucanotransferase, partial [Mycobacteriales bacterium]|nr:4-alpha-glucanotransferase [Mycobacteriales bacterium]